MKKIRINVQIEPELLIQVRHYEAKHLLSRSTALCELIKKGLAYSDLDK